MCIIVSSWDKEQIIHTDWNSDLLHFKLKVEKNVLIMGLDMNLVELAKRTQRVL
jgi:hypothetical protein